MERIRRVLDSLEVPRKHKGYEQIVLGVDYMLQCDIYDYPPRLKDVIGAIAAETGDKYKSIAANIERGAKDCGYYEGARDFLLKVVRIVLMEGKV